MASAMSTAGRTSSCPQVKEPQAEMTMELFNGASWFSVFMEAYRPDHRLFATGKGNQKKISMVYDILPL